MGKGRNPKIRTMQLTQQDRMLIQNRITHLKDLQKAGLIGDLGICLDIGCLYGFDVKSLVDAGANLVYGLEPIGCALNLAISSKRLQERCTLHANLFDIPVLFEQGLVPREGFDTITALRFPVRQISDYETDNDDGIKRYEGFVDRTIAIVRSIAGVKRYFPEGLPERKRIEYIFRDPITEALYCMLYCLKKGGNLILSVIPFREYSTFENIEGHPETVRILKGFQSIGENPAIYKGDGTDLAFIVARKGLTPKLTEDHRILYQS